jgi:hypothetical protein
MEDCKAVFAVDVKAISPLMNSTLSRVTVGCDVLALIKRRVDATE